MIEYGESIDDIPFDEEEDEWVMQFIINDRGETISHVYQCPKCHILCNRQPHYCPECKKPLEAVN